MNKEIEVTLFGFVVGWLKPLLSRVAENRTTVAVPVMDIIDDSTFQYKSFDTNSINIGGFDWSLQFTWISISDREKQRRKSDVAPIRSAADYRHKFCMQITVYLGLINWH